MERPAKRPRLPDGFQKSKPTTPYKPPESIAKFVSAFDKPVKPRPQSRPKSPPWKPVSSATHDRPQNKFVDFDVPNEPEAGPSRPSVPVPQRQPKPVPFAHPPRAAKADKVLPPLKVLKPPMFNLPPAAEPSNKSSGTTLTSLQPMLKPPPAPAEKPRSVLRPPPAPVPPASKPSAALKPLPPPPVPDHRPASPKKPMKTIFTTAVAQATDPTKEGTGAELLSLFIQQHGHTFTSPIDRELRRGVMVSPDKRSRGKEPKFVRGGLAERFQHHIACAETDFVLWRRQTERKLESGFDPTQSACDMQLRILRVLEVAKPAGHARAGVGGPRAGLALCRLTRRHPMAGGELAHGTYVVVFRFGPVQGRCVVSSAERFEAGNDVVAWMPWHRVDLGGTKGLLEMCRTLDALTPPRSLLVVSRFCIVVPKPPPCDLT